MSLLQIRRNAQITLPAKMRKVLGLKEGDLVEAKLVGNQAIIIKPKSVVDKGRSFSDEEIARWLKEDELEKAILVKAKKLVNAK